MTHPGLLHAQVALPYENQVIEQINVKMMNLPEGTAYDTNAIKARIKSKPGELFSQIDFDNDLKKLANDFDRVDPVVESVNGKIYVTLKIWPKPNIRAIIWIGNSKIETKRLEEELGTGPASLFDRRAFNQAFHKLKAYYVGKGYFEAQLSYDVIPDPLCNQVDIQINIDEGRAGRIKNIFFDGFTKDEKCELFDMIATKRYCIFLSWLSDEGTYREEMVQSDELVILNYLQNKGFADARVKVEVREIDQCNRIVIVITADRGEPYRFGSMCVKGNTLFCVEDIMKRFRIREGGCFSPEKLRDTITAISDLYGKYGYIDAVVDYELKLVDGECAYDVEFTIEEGQQYRVGMINVFGNCWTQTSVLLNETLLIPGEVFNIEKLKKTEERLQNIGYFKTVNVYAVKSDGPCAIAENYRDVNIEVEETTTGNFGAFFGFSTTENLFGGFNLTETNFNSEGLNTLASKGLKGLRGGGEYAHFTATLGVRSRSYIFSWSKPYFMDTPWIVGFDIERSSNRYVSKNYDILTTGFTLKGMYPVNQFVKFGTHYRIKNTHIAVSDHHHAPKKLLREAKESGIISAVGTSLTYDSTNHPIQPWKGFKSKFEAEFAGLGGRHHFLSIGYLNTWFKRFPKIDKKGVLKLRADVRFIQPIAGTGSDDVPIDERYFLGGDYTLRGFRPYRPGPKYDDDDPRGGISLQFLSAEYSRPVFKSLELFVFIDSGYLSMDPWAFGRMNTAMGFGAKIHVFGGAPPLMLGMGYPLNAKDRSDVKRFFITMGGRF